MQEGTVAWNQDLSLNTTVEYNKLTGEWQEKLTELQLFDETRKNCIYQTELDLGCCTEFTQPNEMALQL